MFTSRVFRVGPPDAFHVVLEYGYNEPEHASAATEHSYNRCSPRREKVRLPVSHARLELDWTSSEAETSVLERFVQRQSKLLEQHADERIVLHLDWEPIAHASSFPNQRLNVQLKVASSTPVLRSIHLTRTSGSGSASESLVAALLKHVDISTVWKLRGCEGLGHFWVTRTDEPAHWVAIKTLNLSSCGLAAVPASIGQLESLRVLRLNHNKLTSLPAEIGQLTELEVLSLNHNALSTLPVELRCCLHLRELHVEYNRLVTPLLDLTHATSLASLQLYGNPLDYLPELGPAVGLRSLSLANVRILADAAYSRWEVEVTAPSSSYTSMVIGARGHKLQPLFNLVFRRSNIQHPLLMGALSRLVEDPANLELLVREDVALQQLVLAAMGNNSLVVEQAVIVMAAAGSYAGAARRLVKHNVVQACTDLVFSANMSLQLSGLRLLSSLSAGAAEGEVSGDVLVPTQLLDRLLHLIRDAATHTEVRCAALHALGNSAFDPNNRRRYLQSPGLMQLLVNLAAAPDNKQGSATAGDDGKVVVPNASSPAEQCATQHSGISSGRLHLGSPLAATAAAHTQRQTLADDAGVDGQAAGYVSTVGIDVESRPATGILAQQQKPPSVRQHPTTSQSAPMAFPTELGSHLPDGDDAGTVAVPPLLSMQRDASMVRSSPADDSIAAAAAVVSDDGAAGAAACKAAAGSIGGAPATTLGTAAAGLTAVAEAVTAAGSYALAAAVPAAATAPVGGSVGKQDSSSVMPVAASDALAVAAGAAAAVAATPSAGSGTAGSDSTATASASADAVFFPRRKKLVQVDDAVKLQAIRLLAVLGQNEQVRIALGSPPIRGRGLRVLAMDGGGMKGMAMVELLRQLERRAGAPIWTLFDVIGGTSTGGLLAVAAGVLRLTLDECQDIYTKLGNKVFHASAIQEDAGWRDSLYRMYATGSANMRVAVYGAKHDAAPYEELLRKFCAVQELGCASDRLIDTAVLGGPKVFVVATLASVRPAAPFAFRNYELPEEAGAAAAALAACAGSCKHHVWEAVRASSAAPYYLDDFVTPDGKRFQDGATTANNPAAVALAQARLLYPQLPVDVLVSLGCGSEPSNERSKGLSSVIDTGAVLLESACSVDRVHEALATTLPLVPGCQYYRFNAVDPRCAMELDDIKPESWRKLLAATSEYCSRPDIAAQFDKLAELLTTDHQAQMAHVKQPSPVKQLTWRPAGAGQQRGQPQRGASLLNRQGCTGLHSAGTLGLRQGAVDDESNVSRQAACNHVTDPQTASERHRTATQQTEHAQQVSSVSGKAAMPQCVLTAPKLLYQKGVLLVEAPRNMAAASASAAGAAALQSVRQLQQQELVGRMLADSLPQKLLRVCNLSAVGADAVAAAFEPFREASDMQPQMQVADLIQTDQPQHIVQLQLPHTKEQQQALADQDAVAPVHRRRSAPGTSSAAASPKASSWLGYIFPWQSSASTEQGVATACQPAAGAASAVGADKAGGSSGAEASVGTSAVLSEPQLHSIASAQATTCSGSGSDVTMASPDCHWQQQHLEQLKLSAGGDRSSSPASRSPLGKTRWQQQPSPRSPVTDALLGITGWSNSALAKHPQQQSCSRVSAALRRALSAAAGHVGVLHLALHSTPQGLVGGWHQEVTAVVEPGAGAVDLLSFLGAAPTISGLGELVAQQGPLLPAPDGGVVAVLGQQQIYAPAPNTASIYSGRTYDAELGSALGLVQNRCSHFITSWLLQLIKPDERQLIGSQDVYPLLSQLQQLIVVSSSWLPDEMVKVLLRGGVAAVVAATNAEALESLDAVDVASFFEVFYEGLMHLSLDVLQALQRAAAAVGSVRPDVFQCYQL